MDENLARALSDLTGVFSRLAGPLADELGRMAGDKAREYRTRNAIKIFGRIKQMLADAHIVPEAIPPRLFLPAMEAATVENDENLQEHWAALLANSSDPNQRNSILPSFVEILKELTPEEAKFIHNVYRNAPPPGLMYLWDRNSSAERKISPKDRGLRVGNYDALVSLAMVGEPTDLAAADNVFCKSPVGAYQDFSLVVDDLVRLGLLDRLPWYPTPGSPEEPTGLAAFSYHPQSAKPGDSQYFIPPFALAFLKACEPPGRAGI